MKKRVFSLLLALMLVFGVLPVTNMTAYAGENVTNGFYGGTLRVQKGLCPGCYGYSVNVSKVKINSIAINKGTLIIKLQYTCEHGIETSKPNCWQGTGWSSEHTLKISGFNCTKKYSKYDCYDDAYGLTANFTRNASQSVSCWTTSNNRHTGYCNFCKQAITENCSGGTATGSITIGDVTATQTFVIQKADMTDVSASGYSGTYDGTAHGITVTAPTGATVTYRTSETGDYSTDTPGYTNAGSYTVYYKVEQDNYEPATGSATVVIAQVPLTVTADDNSKTYGESDPKLTWNITSGSMVGSDTLTGISATRITGEDAKEYTITASQTEGANPNYDITFATGTFTISQKTIGIEWGGTSFTYDGSEKCPTATATGTIGTDTIELTVTGGEFDADTDYTATVTAIIGEKAANYKLPETNLTQSFSIAKADPLPFTALVGTEETIDGKADGKITNVSNTMEYRKASEADYTDIEGTELTGLAAGTYYVRLKETKNYNASADQEIVIAAGRKLSVTVPAVQTGYTLTADKTALSWKGATGLTFTLAEGYSKLDRFAVKVNGTPITPDASGKYTVSDAQSDLIVTVEGVADITAPTATIALGENRWSSFFHGITFGLFFNNTQSVTVTAEDKGSGLDKVYYHLAAEELSALVERLLSGGKEFTEGEAKQLADMKANAEALRTRLAAIKAEKAAAEKALEASAAQAPATGDESVLWLWLLALLGAGALCVPAVRAKGKRRE